MTNTQPDIEKGHSLEIQRETKHVMMIYSALCASILLSFVPIVAAQFIAFPLMLFSLVGAYYYRAKSINDSLTHNHMTYLIRTFWMSGFLFLIGTVGIGIYLANKYDMNQLNAFLEPMARGEVVMNEGMRSFMKASMIAYAPSIIYFVYRIAKALPRAMNGYRMPDPKSWI